MKTEDIRLIRTEIDGKPAMLATAPGEPDEVLMLNSPEARCLADTVDMMVSLHGLLERLTKAAYDQLPVALRSGESRDRVALYGLSQAGQHLETARNELAQGAKDLYVTVKMDTLIAQHDDLRALLHEADQEVPTVCQEGKA